MQQWHDAKLKTANEKSIYEMADELARETMRGMYKDGKLTHVMAHGRNVQD